MNVLWSDGLACFPSLCSYSHFVSGDLGISPSRIAQEPILAVRTVSSAHIRDRCCRLPKQFHLPDVGCVSSCMMLSAERNLHYWDIEDDLQADG
jgi:hypothetical protein